MATIDRWTDSKMHIRPLLFNKIVSLLARMHVPDRITFFVIFFLRGFLIEIPRVILVKIEKGLYQGLREEFRYVECKITVIGIFVTLLAVFFFLLTENTLPFRDINSQIFAGFISIVAIVPSVSLAVIEISSSGYSKKLARIYRRSFYFWFLLVIDISVIVFSGLGFLDPEIQILKTVTPILAFFGILYLIPYFQAMMRLLDPKKAITKLGQQINLHSLLYILECKTIGPVPPPEDPIFPLIEVGVKAIKERDLETLQLLLEEIVARHEQVLLSLQRMRSKRESTFTGLRILGRIGEINDHFLNHLRSLKKFVFEEKQELGLICLTEYFTKLAEQTMQFKTIDSWQRSNELSFKWIYEIFKLGEENLIFSFWDGTASSLRSLAHLSRRAMENGYEQLQYSIAGFINESSVIIMEMPSLPKHFMPKEILSSMSEVVKHRMEFGVYDYSLEHEIEYLNELSEKVVLKGDPITLHQIMSRCYEKALFISIFDYYVSKNIQANIVAKAIYDSLPFKFLHYNTLMSLLQQGSNRKLVRFSDYTPKKAIEELIEKGLRQISVKSVVSGKYSFEHSARFSLLEISRIFYEFNDSDLILEISESLMKAYYSRKDPDNYRLKEIIDTIFAIYYACVRKDLISAASDLIPSLKKIALFEAEKGSKGYMQVAMLLDYASAVAFDMNKPSLAIEAMNAVIEFDEYQPTKSSFIPDRNHIELLLRDYPSPFRSFSKDEPYLSDGPRSWIFRLFKGEIDMHKRLVTQEAIEQVYTLYLFQKLPLH